MSRMKIGILTFHRAHNYGAMLQAYALHRVLSNMGHDVEFISYRQDAIENAYKPFPSNISLKNGIISNIKTLVATLIKYPRCITRIEAFKSFAKQYLPESVPYSKIKLQKAVLKYDAIFFGSDQIWTTRFLGTFDPVFWGNVKCQGKKIAYAPSMEMTSFTEAQIRFIKQNIRNFDAVSIREQSMQDIFEGLLGIKFPKVLDPTLLCEISDYQPILSKRIHGKENFVLLYQVGPDKLSENLARKIAEDNQLDLIIIDSKVDLYKRKESLDGIGPDGFVSLFRDATVVITNSFHGTAFSLIFERPFISVLVKGRETRIKSLLDIAGLENRSIYDSESGYPGDIMNIDYSIVRVNLKKEKSKSIEFIKTALQ